MDWVNYVIWFQTSLVWPVWPCGSVGKANFGLNTLEIWEKNRSSSAVLLNASKQRWLRMIGSICFDCKDYLLEKECTDKKLKEKCKNKEWGQGQKGNSPQQRCTLGNWWRPSVVLHRLKATPAINKWFSSSLFSYELCFAGGSDFRSGPGTGRFTSSNHRSDGKKCAWVEGTSSTFLSAPTAATPWDHGGHCT